MKRGNLGDFSICHGGSLHKRKLSSMCSTTNPSFRRFPGILHPSCCLSFIPAPHASLRLYTPPLPLLYLWCLCHPQIPLSHLFSTPRVNLFLLFLSISLPLSQFFSLPPARNPSPGLFGGGMRCVNESVLSPSLEGGQ